MSFNLAAFVRDQARDAGIPETHIQAVIHRADMARAAVRQVGKLTPLRGGSPGIMVVSSLDGIEREIESADRASVAAS